MVNKVYKYHCMCKMVVSVYVAVETQQENILLSIKIFYKQTQRVVLSMENVSWKIFGDGCVGRKCMDTMAARPST